MGAASRTDAWTAATLIGRAEIWRRNRICQREWTAVVGRPMGAPRPSFSLSRGPDNRLPHLGEGTTIARRREACMLGRPRPWAEAGDGEEVGCCVHRLTSGWHVSCWLRVKLCLYLCMYMYLYEGMRLPAQSIKGPATAATAPLGRAVSGPSAAPAGGMLLGR